MTQHSLEFGSLRMLPNLLVILQAPPSIALAWLSA